MAKKRCGIIMGNCVEMIQLLLNIWEQDDIPVLIDSKMPPQTCASMLAESSVEQCYIDDSVLETWGKGANVATCKLIPISVSSLTPCIVDTSIYDKYARNYSFEEGIVFYSSGTTSKPKGIALSHNAISRTADAITDYMKPKESDIFFIIKSLIHSSTLVGELLVALKSRIPIVISSSAFTPRSLLLSVDKYKPTILFVNPTLLFLLVKSRRISDCSCESIRAIYTSGSIASPQLLIEAASLFRSTSIYNVYGLTEAGPRVTAQREGDVNTTGGVGRAIRNVEIKIIDQDGKECQCDQEGVIHVKTPGKMLGYIRDGRINEAKDDWIVTNDIGYLDENQELFVLGRKDSMIIRSGHNVYPSYIENVLLLSNMLDHCVVFGVEDLIEGQRIVSFIIPNEIHAKLSAVEIKRRLIVHCSQHLAPYELPQEVHIRSAFPRTATGKVSLARIIEEYEQMRDKANVTKQDP